MFYIDLPPSIAGHHTVGLRGRQTPMLKGRIDRRKPWHLTQGGTLANDTTKKGYPPISPFQSAGRAKMRKYPLSAAVPALSFSTAAMADCGAVILAAFRWKSAKVKASVDQFNLQHGSGCNGSVVAGETVPTMISIIEKGPPDRVSLVAVSLLRDVSNKGVDKGRAARVGLGLSDGSGSGWSLPQDVADARSFIRDVNRGRFPRVEAVMQPTFEPAARPRLHVSDCPSARFRGRRPPNWRAPVRMPP